MRQFFTTEYGTLRVSEATLSAFATLMIERGYSTEQPLESMITALTHAVLEEIIPNHYLNNQRRVIFRLENGEVVGAISSPLKSKNVIERLHSKFGIPMGEIRAQVLKDWLNGKRLSKSRRSRLGIRGNDNYALAAGDRVYIVNPETERIITVVNNDETHAALHNLGRRKGGVFDRNAGKTKGKNRKKKKTYNKGDW